MSHKIDRRDDWFLIEPMEWVSPATCVADLAARAASDASFRALFSPLAVGRSVNMMRTKAEAQWADYQAGGARRERTLRALGL